MFARYAKADQSHNLESRPHAFHVRTTSYLIRLSIAMYLPFQPSPSQANVLLSADPACRPCQSSLIFTYRFLVPPFTTVCFHEPNGPHIHRSLNVHLFPVRRSRVIVVELEDRQQQQPQHHQVEVAA